MRELDYVYATLQRLGARPREIEDLAEEVFTTFQRDWPGREQDRPLRAFLFAVAFRIVSAHRHQETTARVAAREEPPVGPDEGSPPAHRSPLGSAADAEPRARPRRSAPQAPGGGRARSRGLDARDRDRARAFALGGTPLA